MNRLLNNPGSLFVIVGLVAVLRLVFVAFGGLELSPDEMYYWDWSRHPDWCYYSKPPMIAWLLWASTSLLGDTVFGARAVAVVLGTASLLFLYGLVKTLYSERAAVIGVLLALCSPSNMLFNLLITIDAPLMCFWTASMYFIARALRREDDGWGDWVAAGVAGGLALLSKQTAVVLPVMTGLFLIIKAGYRRHLFRGFSAYGLLLILSLAPVLVWQVQNDWITLQHTKEHFAPVGQQVTPEPLPELIGDKLGDFAGFVAAEFGLVGPLTLVLMLMATSAIMRRFNKSSGLDLWLFLTGALPLLGVVALSLAQRVQPNWPAPFYIPLMALTAGWLYRNQDGEPRLCRLRNWALGTGAALALCLYSLPLLVVLPGIGPHVKGMTYRVHDWDVLAAEVQALREAHFGGQPHFIICTNGRRYVSTLAFYLPDQPHVFLWDTDGVVLSQYEVWPGPVDEVGAEALIIAREAPDELSPDIGQSFRALGYLGEVSVAVGPERTYTAHVYAGTDLLAWPPESSR